MSKQEATAAAIGGIVAPSALEAALLASAEREHGDEHLTMDLEVEREALSDRD